MKTINKIFLSLGVAATAFGFSSCVGDLDLEPTNPTDITDVSGDMDRVFADLYLSFATYGANGNTPVQDFDRGMASFQRALSIAEEYPTDEMAWLWDPASYGNINYGLVNPALDCVFGFYSRLMVNIALCNQFIQSVDGGAFNLDEAGRQRAKEYRYQARILRGLCYYYMLSFYDKVPYAEYDTPIGAEPTQLPRAKVYELVTADLEEVVAAYNNPNESGLKLANPYYGFVGLDAAEAILMKIYLNGEVFAGQADYTKAYRHAKNIIDRLGHGGHYGNGLAQSYQALFGCNNEKYVLGNPGSDVNEIIIPIVQDNPNLLSYQGGTYLLCSWIGTNGVEVTTPEPTQDKKYEVTDEEAEANKNSDKPAKNLVQDADGVWHYYKYIENKADFDAAKKEYDELKQNKKDGYKTEVSEVINKTPYSFDPTATGWIAQQWYNAGDGWKCLVARKSFVRKFEWNDVAMTESDDLRTALWQTAKHGFASDNNVSLVGDDWGKNGYLCPKYSNWAYKDDGKIDYVGTPMPQAQTAGDYAIIRLAEVYLSAAEAILMGSEEGTPAEALQYVNYIRERAYGNADHNWSSLTMQQLQDERCRELYQENVRRTDLIRWNLWCTGYTWEWKGNPSSAAGTNLPEYTKLYPIPSRVMTSSSFEQTTGY